MKRIVCIYVGFFLLPAWALGGDGFKLNLTGARYLGMGYAGVGLALDGSAIYINPGALGFLKSNSFQLGTSFVRPSTTFSAQTQGGQNLFDPEDMEENTITPISLFANWRRHDSRLTFGIGVYNPFGYDNQWPPTWQGKLIAQESLLNSLYIQPTVGYRINDQIGIGAGIVYGFGNFLTRRALDINGRNNTEGWLELAGRGNGVGYNIGVLFKFGIRTTGGLNYRSGMRIDVEEGEVNFNVPPSLQSEFSKDTTFSTDFTLPGTLGMGLSYKFLDNLVFALDVDYTFWSVYDEVQLNYELPEEELNPRIPTNLVKNFKNTFSIRLGGEYTIQNRYFLRFGALFSQSPVQDEYVNPEFPDSDRIGVTAGAGILLSNSLMIDLAYKYDFTGESFGELRERVFAGKYESTTNILGLSFSYNF